MIDQSTVSILKGDKAGHVGKWYIHRVLKDAEISLCFPKKNYTAHMLECKNYKSAVQTSAD
jgi:hypothetical protein